MVKVSSRFHATNPVEFFSSYIKGKIGEFFKERGEPFLLQPPCVAYRYKRVSLQYIMGHANIQLTMNYYADGSLESDRSEMLFFH